MHPSPDNFTKPWVLRSVIGPAGLYLFVRASECKSHTEPASSSMTGRRERCRVSTVPLVIMSQY